MAHATANGKDAYTLSWESASGNQRAGFAKVAQSLGSGFEIYPCFSENGEVRARFPPHPLPFHLGRLHPGLAGRLLVIRAEGPAGWGVDDSPGGAGPGVEKPCHRSPQDASAFTQGAFTHARFWSSLSGTRRG